MFEPRTGAAVLLPQTWYYGRLLHRELTRIVAGAGIYDGNDDTGIGVVADAGAVQAGAITISKVDWVALDFITSPAELPVSSERDMAAVQLAGRANVSSEQACVPAAVACHSWLLRVAPTRRSRRTLGFGHPWPPHPSLQSHSGASPQQQVQGAGRRGGGASGGLPNHQQAPKTSHLCQYPAKCTDACSCRHGCSRCRQGRRRRWRARAASCPAQAQARMHRLTPRSARRRRPARLGQPQRIRGRGGAGWAWRKL